MEGLSPGLRYMPLVGAVWQWLSLDLAGVYLSAYRSSVANHLLSRNWIES
jgi:hypothetical protein